MRLLIDTFNVLHVTGVLPPGLAGPDVAGLAALIATSRWQTAQVALVCDGTPPPGGSPRLPPQVHAIYSHDKEADEILERLIRDSTAPRQLLVVSSDRRVRRAARRRGAKDLAADAFLRLLLEDRGQARQKASGIHRPSDLRAGEIAAWQTEFQIEDGTIEVSDQDLPEHLQAPAATTSQPSTHQEAPSPLASAPDPASILPADLLAEANAMIPGHQEPSESTESPDETETPTPLDEESGKLPTRSERDNPVPDDIIREAEDLLRKSQEEDD